MDHSPPAMACPPLSDQSSPLPRDDQFSELYRAHFGRLVLLCRRFLGSGSDAEAVAQEAFIRAWEAWDHYSARRPFWPWVATIARRLCVNETHATGRRYALHARSAARSVALSPSIEDEVEAHHQLVSLRRVLSSLSARQQRLLHLRDIEGWSYEEIARFDGVTVEAVRGALKRARASFRRVYDVRLSGGFGMLALFRRMFHRSERLGGSVLSSLSGVEPAAVAAIVALALAPMATVPPPATGQPSVVEVAAAVPPPPTTTTSVATATDGGARTTERSSSGSSSKEPRAVSSSSATVVPSEDAPLASSYDLEFTPSPSYSQDHTVFASGQARDCTAPTGGCPTLFKSTDGGTTWSALPAKEFPGGPVLLPPAYPRDGRIFAGNLSVSEDGGATFRTIGLVRGAPAMSPLFSDGDPRILFGATVHPAPATLEYDTERDETRATRLALPIGTTAISFAFSPDFARDRRMLVGTLSPGTDRLGSIPAVFLCEPQRCERVLQGDGVVLPSLSWTGGPTGTALAWAGNSVHRSHDGRTFERIPLPSDNPVWPALVTTVVSLPGGRIVASAFLHGMT
ncbi:MAG: sigma-70 family RNA polymerase sigma factor, partial [Actinomycetota bacterium]|nr:sigma-70 family RNA polymerase sigma factor [Actinomycetota bacterium]